MSRLILALPLLLLACDGGSAGGGSGKAKEGATCSVTADCVDGTVCLAYGPGTGICSLDCSVSGTECSGEAQCAGVGSVSVDVCQDSDKVASPESQPEEEERPRLPCAEDADCAEFGSNAICAEWKGQKDCTIPCDTEEDCTPPTVGGVTVDFMTCIPDESDTSRDACLPDEACFNNPLDCISGFPGLGDSDIPGF